MDFAITEEHALIQKTARDYARTRLVPAAAARDVNETFPDEELAELARLGLFGINVPEDFGGSEAGAIAYSLAMRELSRADPSVAVSVSVANMVAELIARFGTEAQKREHIPRLCSGEYRCGAFALSEAGAGSDPVAMQTTADKIPGGYRISGAKMWITCGDRAGIMVVWAKTDSNAGARGITAFLVRGDAPGLSVTRLEDKMGIRGSHTAELSFDNVEVGDDAVLGDVGGGFRLAMIALDGGRIGISSQAIGIAEAALAAAVDFARERETFGQPIIDHQAIGNLLADMATAIEAAKLMVMRAAWLKDQKRPFSMEASMAKLFCTERAIRICDDAIQIHGGYGYTRDFPVERFYRDVRVTAIYEGTSQIQRIVIARHLLKSLES